MSVRAADSWSMVHQILLGTTKPFAQNTILYQKLDTMAQSTEQSVQPNLWAADGPADPVNPALDIHRTRTAEPEGSVPFRLTGTDPESCREARGDQASVFFVTVPSRYTPARRMHRRLNKNRRE
jgi:hypothetical protein